MYTINKAITKHGTWTCSGFRIVACYMYMSITNLMRIKLDCRVYEESSRLYNNVAKDYALMYVRLLEVLFGFLSDKNYVA